MTRGQWSFKEQNAQYFRMHSSISSNKNVTIQTVKRETISLLKICTKWQLKLLTISRLIIASLCVYLRVQKIWCVTRHLITKPQITPRLSKSRSVDDIHCMSAVQSRGNCDFFKTPKTQMTPK